MRDVGSILDSWAKEEYKHRIDELRKDKEEAERFNDLYRAARARSEIDAIAEQLAAAVGLEGKDRRSSSDAGRARSSRHEADQRGYQQNRRGQSRTRPPLGRQN